MIVAKHGKLSLHHIIDGQNIPSSCHKNKEYFASLIIEFVVQMPTRHISFHIGIVPVQSIYDKSLMTFSSNI
jgi:hypothetical protein